MDTNGVLDGDAPHLAHGGNEDETAERASSLSFLPAHVPAPADVRSEQPALAPGTSAESETVPERAPDTSQRRGAGPWLGPLPEGDHWDADLLAEGDYRNVEDRFRYWKRDAIKAEIARRSLGYEIAIENLGHDFNIGSIVRTSNALGASKVHIVGRRRWNRRGAMVTDRYLNVVHHPDVASFLEDVSGRLRIIGVDNIPGSVALEETELPQQAVLVFGEESAGLSSEMAAACEEIVHITQYGSTRSMNVGHAAAIAMWAWVARWSTPHQPKS